MFLVAFLLFSAPSVIPFRFVLSHSYLFSFNSISPSVIKKGFTFSLLNTDEEHQKALKDLEVARRNLQVFFTVLMMFLPHCKAYFKWSYSGSQDVFRFLCLQFETFNIVNIDFSWDFLLYYYILSFSIFWCIIIIFFYEYHCLLWLKESASNLDEVLKERDDLSETCADLKQQMAQVKESSLLTMALYKQYVAQVNTTMPII